MQYQKGDACQVFPPEFDFSNFSPEMMANIVLINVTDSKFDDVKKFKKQWERNAIVSITQSKPLTDEINISINSINHQFNGRGKIDTNDVKFLSNLSIQDSIVDGSINSSIPVFNLIKSIDIFPMDISGLIFNSINYKQQTGIHTIECNYSGTSIHHNTIGLNIDSLHNIISHDTVSKIITFEVDRAYIIDKLTRILNERLQKRIGASQYKIPDTIVNSIAGSGGYVQNTLSEFNSFLMDKTIG
jgi:hypothetical protein